MAVLNVSASEFLGRADTGRSQPMKCICETDNGQEVEVYVKYENFHSELALDHLTGELVANQFARDLGLPAAEPCLVDVSQDFLDTLSSVPDGQAIQDAFGYAPKTAFGSVAFHQIRRWDARNFVHRGQVEQAAQLYLFDTIVENSDRGIGNSNLLSVGHEFRVIDFGHSFQRCHEITSDYWGPKPWAPGGICNHISGSLQHVLFENLRRHDTCLAIDAFHDSLSSLSDNTIQDYVNIVPVDWGQDCACNIVDYLLEARARAADFNTRAKEVLL
ncbi:HipA family kinase [Phaeobacter inhibens]|uniref:HipA family kinase n=1 Tax=Phaeobacter inhibens TaxID=221822 RepID=UPI0021A55093|nr:HipA family kinase [Phaeobacter inhibens]UWS06405.1 hypothetical protein K4K98_08950 [Phaeobacter inhibens]